MKTPKTFEAGLARLEEVLALLQDEKTPLAQAVKLYAEAAQLVASCDEALQKAKLEIQEIDEKMGTSEGEDAQ